MAVYEPAAVVGGEYDLWVAYSLQNGAPPTGDLWDPQTYIDHSLGGGNFGCISQFQLNVDKEIVERNTRCGRRRLSLPPDSTLNVTSALLRAAEKEISGVLERLGVRFGNISLPDPEPSPQEYQGHIWWLAWNQVAGDLRFRSHGLLASGAVDFPNDEFATIQMTITNDAEAAGVARTT